MTDAGHLDAPSSDLEPDEKLVETEIRRLRADVERIESELSRAIIGQSAVRRELIVAILAGGHVLLEGVPGLGKTLLARSVATVLGLEFGRVQCTPDLIPADVTGTDILVEIETGAHEIRFRPGPVFSSVVLADEINRATPKTQSAFLEAMEEGQVTIGGTSHPLPRPFVVLATQNPIELEGTFPLPEAQLDRFLFKISIDNPSRDELRRIALETTGSERADLRAILSPDRVLAMQRIARQIPVASELLDAVVRVVRATHPDNEEATQAVRRFVRFGASPRAVQAIVLGAKVHAVLEGRYHVAPSDLSVVAPPALRHRLLLNFEASAEPSGADDLIAELAESLSR